MLISLIIFKKYKKFVLIYFQIKNILKNKYFHNSKHPIIRGLPKITQINRHKSVNFKKA
jgi:hypothetical protein